MTFEDEMVNCCDHDGEIGFHGHGEDDTACDCHCGIGKGR